MENSSTRGVTGRRPHTCLSMSRQQPAEQKRVRAFMSIDTAAAPPAAEKTRKRRGWRAVLLFIREVIAELRKVVTPTRKELIRYTITVLVFVAVVIVAVIGLDLVFGTISTQLFTGTAEQ